MGRQKVWEPEVLQRGAPSSGGSRQDGPSGPEIRLEATKKKGEMAEAPASPGGGAWKHKEPLGGGPVDRSEWTHPEVGRAEEHGWRHQRMDWYYIGGRGAHGDQFNRASRTNCQPASQPETSRMSGKGANLQEKIPCPKCRTRVQRRNLRKHDRSMHQGVRRRRHFCPYCSAEKCKTYSTFQDWKNHLHDTHELKLSSFSKASLVTGKSSLTVLCLAAGSLRDLSLGRRAAVTLESLLCPFGDLDPCVGRHVRAAYGASSRCPQTEILRDMALWLMTCFNPSTNWMRL